MMPPSKVNGRASVTLINLALAGYVALELAVIAYIVVITIKKT